MSCASGRPRRWILATIALVYVVWRVGAVLAANGAFATAGNKHANSATGPLRDAAYPRGTCPQCHIMHNGAGAPQDFALFAADDNALCYTCHAAAYQRAWPGSATYDGSGHGSQGANYVVNARPVKLCVQCHNPHGNRDVTNGLYPSLTQYLEEGGAAGGYTKGGCYSNTAGATGSGCHGNVAGNRPPSAPDIYTLFTKVVKHPIATATKVHVSTEAQVAGWNPAASRHVECVDCHNPHRAKAGSHAPPTNVLSRILLGTWGVEPTFGAAWTQPTVFAIKTFTNDPPLATDKEYQLCLKCHSYYGWTVTPPATYTCQAREFNPANPGYHMVIATTRPAGSWAGPFKMVTTSYGWNTTSNMYCCDCHSADTATATLNSPKGPHGSANTRLLWGPWANNTGAAGTTGHLCFKCHDWNAYGSGGTLTAAANSGFSNAGDGNLHVLHMGKGPTCWNCHTKIAHGWKWKAMIAQRADQPAYPLYYGVSATYGAWWISVTTWKAPGNWTQGDCDHGT